MKQQFCRVAALVAILSTSACASDPKPTQESTMDAPVASADWEAAFDQLAQSLGRFADRFSFDQRPSFLFFDASLPDIAVVTGAGSVGNDSGLDQTVALLADSREQLREISKTLQASRTSSWGTGAAAGGVASESLGTVAAAMGTGSMGFLFEAPRVRYHRQQLNAAESSIALDRLAAGRDRDGFFDLLARIFSSEVRIVVDLRSNPVGANLYFDGRSWGLTNVVLAMSRRALLLGELRMPDGEVLCVIRERAKIENLPSRRRLLVVCE